MYIASIFLCIAVLSGHVTAKDERELKGKVAVITGGAKGIGRAIVENFLKAGVSNVTIVDKNKTRGLETEKTFNLLYGNRVWFIHGDVTKDLDRVWRAVYKRFGCVNVLVNDAGIINEYDPELTIKTNLLAPMLWSERFYNCMRTDRGGEGGTILNVASISSISKDPFYWNYKSSKYGVLGLTYGLGHEYNYMFTKVAVIAICPSFTHTDMTAQQMVVDEQVGIYTKVNEVVQWQGPDAVGRAAVTVFKIAETGTAYTVEGGQLSPTAANTTMSAAYLLSL